MKFDLADPTRIQVRHGLITGIIAESVAIPVLFVAIFLSSQSIRWPYIVGAIGCVFVTVVYLALTLALSQGAPDLASRANVGFVVVCLALSGLGLLAVGTSDRQGVFRPAVLVGVVFVSVIGDRRMRIAIDAYAIALIGAITWAEGLRGQDLAAMVLVYAWTIVIVTWIIDRTVGSLSETVNFRRAVGALSDAFDDVGPEDAESSTDLIHKVFQRGLPLVPGVMPAERIAVFSRTAGVGRFTNLATWPSDSTDVSDLADLSELGQALRADSVILSEPRCVIPIGYCGDGELVMVIDRSPTGIHNEQQAQEAAEILAAEFLRVTSRVNFVTGLQAESRTDPLTGLANRRTLNERIQIEMEHALRSETPLSIAMIDLDHFKEYNDQFGHVAGDTLLRSLAAVMVSNIRGQDLVVRYGGEEFCLVMPDTDIVGGHHLLDKLRSGGRDATSEIGVTLSAGLTSWDGVEDATSLIERADQALYRAKESGRNRVVSIQSYTEF